MPIRLNPIHGPPVNGSFRTHVIDKDCLGLWCPPWVGCMGGMSDTRTDTIPLPAKPSAPVFKLRLTSKSHYVLPITGGQLTTLMGPDGSWYDGDDPNPDEDDPS